MQQEEIIRLATLEALLFYYGEPLAKKKIEKILLWSGEQLNKTLEALSYEYKENIKRGLTLIETVEGFQLVTKPEYKTIGEKLIKEELREELTPAALETLALIAYTGPLARATIDYVRGVNSSFIIRNLLVRGLIIRTERGKGGYVYTISEKTLHHLGLVRKEDLPEYEVYKNMIEKFETKESVQNNQEQKK